MELVVTAAASATTPKELFKDIIHIRSAAATTSLFLLSDSLLAELVVCGPLVWVAQCLVGIGNFLELLFSTFWIISILIWMMLNS